MTRAYYRHCGVGVSFAGGRPASSPPSLEPTGTSSEVTASRDRRSPGDRRGGAARLLDMPALDVESVPASHSSAVAGLTAFMAQQPDVEMADITGMWPCSVGGVPAVLGFLEDTVALVAPGGAGGAGTRIRYSRITALGRSGTGLTIAIDTVSTLSVDLPSGADAAMLGNQLMQLGAAAPPPPADRAAAAIAAGRVLIVTTNDLPGYRVLAVHGDVFGLSVRTRNVFSNMGAGVRSLVGGEVGSYLKLLTDARNEARERLAQAALERGGNAVLAMRFDCTEISELINEVVAYGTAVSVGKQP